ncbi:hypothetical protein H8E52_06695 [bacterium]|nr:hypothetical protein [bacterium]
MRKMNMCFLLGMLMLSGAGQSLATIEVKVEAESYDPFSTQNNGGDSIHVGFCESASQEYCADGVDMDGDWIQLYMYVPANGNYDGFMAFQAIDDVHSYLVSIWPQGREDRIQTMNFGFTGIGAG